MELDSIRPYPCDHIPAQVLETDCLSFYSENPEYRVDHMITDPPYVARVHKKAITQISYGGQARDLGFAHLSSSVRSATAHWAACNVDRWTFVYSDLQGSTWWRLAGQAHGLEHVRDVPWVRWSMPQLSADRPPSGAEMTVWMHNRKGKKRWDGPGNFTHLDHPCLRARNKYGHKTEKPLIQLLDVISWLCEEDETVLDPFAGAATVGVACQMLGVFYVGMDMDPEWAEKGTKRLRTYTEKDLATYQRWYASLNRRKEDRDRRKNITYGARKRGERVTEEKNRRAGRYGFVGGEASTDQQGERNAPGHLLREASRQLNSGGSSRNGGRNLHGMFGRGQVFR